MSRTIGGSPRTQRVTVLPPPSLNQLYTTAIVDGHPRIFLTKEAREWKKGHANMLTFLKPVPVPRDVRVEVLWLMTPDDDGDIDNRLKLLLDTLQGHGYENDKQIAELLIYRARNQKWSRMEITISDLSQPKRQAQEIPDQEAET